jgi:hypothetical protein
VHVGPLTDEMQSYVVSAFSAGEANNSELLGSLVPPRLLRHMGNEAVPIKQTVCSVTSYENVLCDVRHETCAAFTTPTVLFLVN